jgi:hypothetical protein
MQYPVEVPNRTADIFRMIGHMLSKHLLHRRGLVVVSLVDDGRQAFPRRRGATSTFASMRSIREALGFIGVGPLAPSVCPVASNPMGDLVHAGFELLKLLRLKARAHYAQAVADAGADLAVERSIRHATDRLR